MTRTLAASLAAITILLSAGSALATTGYATRNVDLREGAGTKYDIVGSLKKGEEVEIVGCGGGWCETEEGFVKSSYLKVIEEDDEDDDDEEYSFIDEDGEFDDDPLGITDDVPESIHDD